MKTYIESVVLDSNEARLAERSNVGRNASGDFGGMLEQTTIFLVVSILFAILFFFHTPALAFVASEVGSGYVELRSHMDRGLYVTEVAKRSTNVREWVYFCVSEGARTPSFVSKKSSRCFYGDTTMFRNVQKGQSFLGVEYGLKSRVLNDKDLIPIGTGRYFYPVAVLR